MQSPIAVRLGGLALTLALAGGLAGCDDDPVPQIPDATGTPSASATPDEPVEPTLPAAAEGTSRAAAEAFLPYFYEVVDYAQATGDTTTLRALCLPSSKACAGGASIIERIHRSGGTIAGGIHTVESAQVTGVRTVVKDVAIHYLRVKVSHTAQTVTGSKHHDGNYGAGSDTFNYELISSRSGWRVSEWAEQ